MCVPGSSYVTLTGMQKHRCLKLWMNNNQTNKKPEWIQICSCPLESRLSIGWFTETQSLTPDQATVARKKSFIGKKPWAGPGSYGSGPLSFQVSLHLKRLLNSSIPSKSWRLGVGSKMTMEQQRLIWVEREDRSGVKTLPSCSEPGQHPEGSHSYIEKKGSEASRLILLAFLTVCCWQWKSLKRDPWC